MATSVLFLGLSHDQRLEFIQVLGSGIHDHERSDLVLRFVLAATRSGE